MHPGCPPMIMKFHSIVRGIPGKFRIQVSSGRRSFHGHGFVSSSRPPAVRDEAGLEISRSMIPVRVSGASG